MKTVLLTGASSGLGLAIAKQLIPLKEYRLVLTARKSSLPRFKNEGIEENERILLRPLDRFQSNLMKSGGIFWPNYCVAHQSLIPDKLLLLAL